MARISRRVMGTPLNGQRETELHIVYSAVPDPYSNTVVGQDRSIKSRWEGMAAWN